MKTILCALIALITPALLAADDDVQKELKALQGKWKTVAMEAGGNALPKEATLNFTIEITADGKGTGKLPEEEIRFTLTVDPKKNPKTINNLHESGNQQGKKQFGVYKLEGDKWTVCMSPPDSNESDRPKDFNTKDNNNVVFVFERVK
jgi:uncharacterized protein (TIGR03067 family)